MAVDSRLESGNFLSRRQQKDLSKRWTGEHYVYTLNLEPRVQVLPTSAGESEGRRQ